MKANTILDADFLDFRNKNINKLSLRLDFTGKKSFTRLDLR
jgi:hypothetical protein